jgi:hypothetical protein
MQAMPISNPSPANASSPATAALLPFDPHSSSPFTVIFQAVLKGGGNSGKFPVAGKPQDSSREPARSTATTNNLSGLLPQSLILPTVAPILSDLSLPAVAAPVVSDIALTQGKEALSNSFPLDPTAGLAINSIEPNSTPMAAAASTTNFVKGQPASSNPIPLEAAAGMAADPFQSDGNQQPTEALTTTSPTTASASNFTMGAAALPNPLSLVPPEAQAGVAINYFQTNGAPAATAALTATSPSSESTSSIANAVYAGLLAQGLISAVTIAANNSDPQQTLDSSIGVSQPPAPSQSAAPCTAAVFVQTSAPNGSPISADAFMKIAVEQSIPTVPIVDSNFVTQESSRLANQTGIPNTRVGSQSQPQGISAVSFLGPHVTSTSGPTLPNSQMTQAAHANSSLLNATTLIPGGAAAKVSVAGSLQSAANQSAQSNSQPPADASLSPAETLVHSVAQSAAIGASTLRIHGNLQSPGANPALPTPVAPVPAKTQAQDSSNGSPGNDSNAKPDGVSKVAGAQTDEKAFVQSLDTAGANPMNGHSAAADPNAAAASPPVQSQIVSSGVSTSAPSSADPRPAGSLPGAMQNAPVVSAAHIVNQSGQTEIRIEMQADSLGGVELRAHIAGDQIGASIAVEHHDAQVALALDLPTLHTALVEKNLRVETLTVSQGNFSPLTGGSGQDAGQRGFTQSPAKFAYLEQPEQAQAFTETPAEWAGPPNSNAGLSVVA